MLHQVRQNAFPDHLLLWIFRQDRHKSYCSSQSGNYISLHHDDDHVSLDEHGEKKSYDVTFQL